MAMKDLLDRFKREPEEELPEELPVEEKTSFVFTDINSEPIDPAQETAPEAPAHNGPVKVGSSDNDRIQVFELDLGGSKNKAPVEPEPTLTYEPPVYEAPVEEPPVVSEPEGDDTIVVAPTPVTADASEDYEVDFGYAAPGALDDVTYTTDPASVPKPAAPEPVVYQEAPAADNGEEEYYDSYEPIFEESYGPGTYFAGNSGRAPAEEPAGPVSEEPEETVESATYAETEERPRYENYRKDYMEDSDGAPRSYENNIDDSVFLPDEEEAPFSSKRNRRRLTIAIIAVLAALLLVLGGVLISHFAGRSSNKDAELATSSKVKTTAFERSVSNNADATETTTEEASAEYDDEGQTSASSTSATSSSSTQSTSRRSSTSTTTSRSTTTRSTTSRTTTTTTATTTAPTTQPSTAPPSTDPVTEPPTQGPSPWDRVNP